ncbi:MAG: hypothetical protein GY835_03060 [bacterium]|nr:hypothetical protein [bacterium]
MKRFGVIWLPALAIVVLAVFFIWGYQAHRRQIFPYRILRSIAAQAGLAKPIPQSLGDRTQPDRDLLATLPYVSGTFDPKSSTSGVTSHQPNDAFPGVNFYNSYEADRSLLISMRGRVLYEWRYPHAGWIHAELLPNGDVLAVMPRRKLIRINRRSEVQWTYDGNFHHDLWVDDSGLVYALLMIPRLIADLHPVHLIRDDVILILTENGEARDEISLVDAFRRSPYAFLIPSVAHREFTGGPGEKYLDLLHANHVEVFDGRQAHLSTLFARGNILVSLRNIDTVAILDGETREILWVWGPVNLFQQHHPTLLPNGHILIFNNGSKASQILELDPLRNVVTWLYEARGEFFSKRRGSNQRLPNGNTLITESDTGYVFEVTPDGRVVWKFANPEVKADGIRAAIWRMTRFQRSELEFLRRR